MTYLTNHKLVVRNVKTSDRFWNLIDAMNIKDLIRYVFDMGEYDENAQEVVFMPWEPVSWANRVTDMMFIAEKLPEMYFQLDGIGESFGDVWRQYYHDMDIESCSGEILFEQPKKVQWTELVPF